MKKNKLFIGLTLAFIPIPLIWSAAIKSVIAETSVVQTLETQESSAEVNHEAPAPAVDTLEIPKTPINTLSTQTETQTYSTTGKTIHTYPPLSDTTAGAEATCSLISWKILNLAKDDAAQITCDIKDTGNDGNSVYVKWWLDGYADVHLTDSNGYHSDPVHKTDARRNPDGSIGHVYWQVCRDIPFWTDNCDADPQVWTIK